MTCKEINRRWSSSPDTDTIPWHFYDTLAQAWHNTPANYINHSGWIVSQRPALYKLDNYDGYHGSNSMQRILPILYLRNIFIVDIAIIHDT